jgi:hypothetical protein
MIYYNNLTLELHSYMVDISIEGAKDEFFLYFIFIYSRNERKEFPVKLTNPPTAILYISWDKVHIDELKHTLHVQEVDIGK